jgi:hypothetical protein
MLDTVVRVFELILSVAFFLLALHPQTRIVGAMPGRRKSGPPISRAGRVILVMLAMLVAVDGIRALLHLPPLEFDIVHWRLVS